MMVLLEDAAGLQDVHRAQAGTTSPNPPPSQPGPIQIIITVCEFMILFQAVFLHSTSESSYKAASPES